jgi:hypothetical protein
VNGRLVRRSDLTRAERDAMFTLLGAHFHGVDRRTFTRDLEEKNWVLLFVDQGRLAGFSTLLAYDTSYAGESISVVYSGDTIMEPAAWRTSALPRSWIGAVRALHEEFLHSEKVYWLLLTSGFRTYRLLPVFWRQFFPRFDGAMPPDAPALVQELATARFGRCYDPHAGIVRFAAPQVLRDRLQEVAPGRRQDPHVAFFLERNPKWVEGDELVCLTEISFDNLTPAGRRMWSRGRCERHELEPIP